MSWLTEIFGGDDAERRRRAEDADQAERNRQAAERDRLQGVYGQNAQSSLQGQLEAINRQRGADSFGMQQQRANALGGTSSYDLNGDGIIGPGESSTVDSRQSMQGRFGQAMTNSLNKGGLTSSTLGLGKEAGYSKNLNDQLFGLQAQQEQNAAKAEGDLTAQMAAMGNQAGKTFKKVGNQIVGA